MEKYLFPERSDSNTKSPTASKEWKYWLRTLQSFLDSLDSNSNKTGNIEKLNLLKSLNSPAVYEYIADCTTYDGDISKLNELSIRPSNEIFARHKLVTRKQNPGEPIDELLQSFRNLAKDLILKPLMQKLIAKDQLNMLLYRDFHQI